MFAFLRKCLVALLCLGFTSIFAQKSLNEITVKTTKLPQKESELSKPMIVLSDSLIRQYSGYSVTQLLQNQAGLQVVGANQTPGSVQSVYLRGAQTGKTLILIDGLPMYDPSFIESNFDLNLINLEDIERVEILKGGQSALYGSDAVAGVINFITKSRSAKPFQTSSYLSYGSFNTLNLGADVAGGLQGLHYKLGLNALRTDGFSSANGEGFENDGLRRLNISAELGKKVGSTDLTFLTRISDYKSDLDAGAFTDDKDNTFNSRNVQLGLKGNRVSENGQLHFNVLRTLTDRTFEDDSTDVPPTAFNNYSLNTLGSVADFAELFGSFQIGNSSQLLLGTDFRRQSMEQTYFSVSSFGPFEDLPIENSETTTHNFSVYSSISSALENGLGLELSGRLNSHDVYGTNHSYALNPYFILNKNLTFFGVYSKSFKNPSLYQLFSPYGNLELEPEDAKTFDFGFRSAFADQKARIEATYFNRNTSNLIIYQSIDVDPYGQYINQDQQNANGFEVIASYAFSKIGFSGNYTYLTKPEESENQFIRRPKDQFSLATQLLLSEKLRFNFDVNFVGSRTDRFYNSETFSTEEVALSAYTLVNCGVSYALPAGFSVYGSAQNLLNSEYQEIYGFNSQTRNVQLGIRYR
ncbi:TonB-dependent siderophore receptor [Jiulongibacter sediminis]|jgi:vitamin B12 transporter|uniref:TonB-dependent receptor plug domain-containing protein n=1 Tax=Jiulongibacter sediminis TaxID=1605367 RepID=UPI0026EA18D7|nr:TonB-dependent receptor [Jiulongibacter sediminis]